MTTTQDPAQHLASLTSAVHALLRQTGTRLTRAQLAERLGVSDRTLRRMQAAGDLPRTMKDGKWLLADIMQWESTR